MNENDFFHLAGDDLFYINRAEKIHISQGGNRGRVSKPFVFLHLDIDENSGRIRQLGAFTPELAYTPKVLSKSDGYTRASQAGWSSCFVPVKSPMNHTTRDPNYHVFKTMGFESLEFFQENQTYLRCLEESEALLRFLQYLTPFKFCFGGVTLVTFREQDIKFLLGKISDCSLTQLFMSSVTDFLTLLHVLSTPEVPASFEHLIRMRSVALCCLLDNSAQKARALAHAFVSSGETFNSEIERKEFSLLEEYFHMNYSIKLDEGNEENTVLYMGDLDLKVEEDDIREIIGSLVGILNVDYSVKMCNHPKTRVFLGYAYVQFSYHDQALKTLSRLNNEHLRGKPMRVVWHSKNAISPEKWRSNLFVKNIPFSIEQKELNDTFRAFGKILSSKVSMDNRGESKGFGFIQFDKEEDAERAIERMHNLYLAPDKNLFVSIKLSDEERRKRKKSKTDNQGLAVNVNFGGYSTLDVENMVEQFNYYGAVNSAIANQQKKTSALIIYDLESCAANSLVQDGKRLLGTRMEVSMGQAWMNESSGDEKSTTLFVGNLGPMMTSSELRTLFASNPFHCPILSAKVKTDNNGASLMYGYVTIHWRFAKRVVEFFNGKVLEGGNKINVFDGDEEDAEEGSMNEGASTSKGKTVPPRAIPSLAKEPPKIDPMSQLSNRIRNAVRKKKKDAATVRDLVEVNKSEASPQPASSTNPYSGMTSSAPVGSIFPIMNSSTMPGTGDQGQHTYDNLHHQQHGWGGGHPAAARSATGYPGDHGAGYPVGHGGSYPGADGHGGSYPGPGDQYRGYSGNGAPHQGYGAYGSSGIYNPAFGSHSYSGEQHSSEARDRVRPGYPPSPLGRRYSRSPSPVPSPPPDDRGFSMQRTSYSHQDFNIRQNRFDHPQGEYEDSNSWSRGRRRSRSRSRSRRSRSRSRSWDRSSSSASKNWRRSSPRRSRSRDRTWRR